MVMDDDDMRYFLHSLHEAFGELGDSMFQLLLLLALCILVFKWTSLFEMKIKNLKNGTMKDKIK